jgi:hypothetical protein
MLKRGRKLAQTIVFVQKIVQKNTRTWIPSQSQVPVPVRPRQVWKGSQIVQDPAKCRRTQDCLLREVKTLQEKEVKVAVGVVEVGVI